MSGPLSAEPGALPAVQGISAVTLATHDMARAVRFYRSPGFVFFSGLFTWLFAKDIIGAIPEMALRYLAIFTSLCVAYAGLIRLRQPGSNPAH